MMFARLHPLALCLAAAFPLAPAIATAADALASPAAAAEPVVVVAGQRQHYRSLSATGATKTDALLKDLPQSVRVLTADLLADTGATSLASALDLASAISRQSNLGGLWDSYAMRGFTGDPNFGSDYLVNGFSSSRGYNGLRDAASTDSIEVLKGPASALYGRGEPGGTVNIITKKPRFVPAYAADFSIGSYRTRRGAIDLTGPLSEHLAYRFNLAHQEGDSFRDTISSARTLVSPSFIWLIGSATTLSYEIEASRQKTPFDRGVPAVGGVLGLVPNSRFLGEPADGPVTVSSFGQQLFLRHELHPRWSLQAGLSYRDSELAGFSSELNDILADGRTARRQRRHRDWSSTDVSGRIELVGAVAAAGLTHHLLAGTDFYRFDDDRVSLRRNPSAASGYQIDIKAPVYGGVADALMLLSSTLEHQRARGVYVQDQIDLTARWKALLGLRHDRYEQHIGNRRTQGITAQALNAWSPRAGLVYQPTARLALYASVARSFRPNSGISLDNQGFAPERSHALEAGAKFDSADGKLNTTLALYRIAKKNVLTTNPLDTNFSISAGEVGSKGVELDVSGEIARDVRLSAAYAWTDAAVTRGDNTIVTGSAFPNVPRQSANIIVTPRFRLGRGMATLGGGLNYVGERSGDVAVSSNFRLPAYTTAQLIASWAPDQQLRLALNVANLFDKTYYASSYSRLWVSPGTARTVTLNARYRF